MKGGLRVGGSLGGEHGDSWRRDFPGFFRGVLKVREWLLLQKGKG
jgi:hypothetical protein